MRLAKWSILIYLLRTSSESLMISSISCSYIFSPIVIIAYLNSSTLSIPSWSLSKTCKASIKSLSASTSLFFSLSLISSSSWGKVNVPVFYGSILLIISTISVSVGFRFKALTMVPNSVAWTLPVWFLSKRSKISLISVFLRSIGWKISY